jgi:hypothetical protein
MSAELKLDDFLHSLIVFMAAGAGSLAVGSTPRALWREVADESKSGNCADPFSVVRSYGGGPATWKDQALDRRSFQCVTLGKVRSPRWPRRRSFMPRCGMPPASRCG